MAKLDLLRTADDPRRFELGGVGTLTFLTGGIRKATALAGEREWSLTRTGIAGKSKEAWIPGGDLIGSYRPERWHRGEFGEGNPLLWDGREYRLFRSTKTGADFQVRSGDEELFTMHARRFHKSRPEMGTVWVEDWAASDPGLLLFAVFAKFGEGKG